MPAPRVCPTPICIVLLLSCLPARAQSPWEWRYPYPQGNDLRAVDINRTHAVAVGILGMIITSTNFGATWTVTPLAAGQSVGLRGASMASLSVMVAVGEGGVIVRSSNGGALWNTIASGTTSDLNAVDFLDANNGMAVGSAGVILQSVDGGQNWSPRTSGTGGDLAGIDFTTSTIATAVGGATILRTIDGGDSWSPQTSPVGALNSVDFINALTGVALGGKEVVWTTNGGANWTPHSPSFPPQLFVELTSVSMTGPQDAVAVGWAYPDFDPFELGVMMRTSNGGATWDLSVEPTNLFGIATGAGGAGLAVGASGIIRSVPDWAQIHGGQQWFNSWAIDFGSSLNGVAVFSHYPLGTAGDAKLMFTTDGGATWNRTSSDFSYYEVRDVAFADATTAYAVGGGPWNLDVGASAWRSIDGGATWELMYSEACPPPDCGGQGFFQMAQAVDFAGPALGFAVGNGGAIRFDLGVGSHVSEPTGDWGVAVPSPQVAYTVGSAGTIVKGELVQSNWTWLPQQSGTSNLLHDGFFFDDLTGLAVGESGTIIKTTNGGATWTPRVSGTNASLTAITFIDQFGVIAAGGDVLVTTDGGESWSSSGPTPCGIIDVVLVDTVHMVAIGGHDNIIVRSGSPVSVKTTVPTSSLSLWPNQPNPFNPNTRIRFALPLQQHMDMTVFDARGRLVATLWEGTQAAGEHEIEWDGKDASGKVVASGVYFCRLRAGTQSVAMKMVLLK
jgi:photosystem II stability/assembly factor-like uncharacterized protein